MTDEERFRRALERIRDYRIEGPVDEWAEAAAYSAVVEIAADALTPGLIGARRQHELDIERRDRALAKQLRRESSAGKRHTYDNCVVCVLNEKAERPDLVNVKVEQVTDRGLVHPSYRVGDRFTVNVHNLKDHTP